MTSFIIADDHPIIRLGIKNVILENPDYHLLGEASDGHTLIELVREQIPSILILDINMPELDGLEVTRRLLGRYSNLKILILTGSSSLDYFRIFMEIGVKGYILKDDPPEVLQEAINGLLRNELTVSPKVMQRVINDRFDLQEKSLTTLLSKRELQILKLFSQNYSVKAIAEKLCLSEKTVYSYRYRIFNKLNVKTNIELYNVAIQAGLVETQFSVDSVAE